MHSSYAVVESGLRRQRFEGQDYPIRAKINPRLVRGVVYPESHPKSSNDWRIHDHMVTMMFGGS